MYEIEKGIPLPKGTHGRQCPYPLDKLNVGESFLITADSREYVSAKCSRYGRQHGKKFATKQVDGGVRVWRIS